MEHWYGPTLNTTYSTPELPSYSNWVIGYKDHTGNAKYIIEVWSRGTGYDNRCTLNSF